MQVSGNWERACDRRRVVRNDRRSVGASRTGARVNAGGRRAGTAGAPETLAGQWHLNKELSTLPQQRALPSRSLLVAGAGRGGGGGGGYGGRGGFGGRGGSGRSGGCSGGDPQTMSTTC
jgi:hypothetical protein